LNEQSSILGPCTSCEVETEILGPYATTKAVLEHATVPSQTLGTVAAQTIACLDEQITLRRAAGVKLQQLAGRRECGQDFRARECVGLAHLIEC
jgi:hypothetical protein